MNDSLYVFLSPVGARRTQVEHYDFRHTNLLRPIHQSTPFSVW